MEWLTIPYSQLSNFHRFTLFSIIFTKLSLAFSYIIYVWNIEKNIRIISLTLHWSSYLWLLSRPISSTSKIDLGKKIEKNLKKFCSSREAYIPCITRHVRNIKIGEGDDSFRYLVHIFYVALNLGVIRFQVSPTVF